MLEQKFSSHLIGFPDGGNMESTVYIYAGEKTTVILYTHIDQHAGKPKQR